MNYIGEKIKELRRKNNMTQEKLAELLSVSYQTVSKWECGISSPDVYMIAPLARLFNVTTDEILGVSDGNARRAEYDAAYENYWQKDIAEMYEKAQCAVSEFPGDMKYLEWLASMEYYVAFDDEDYCNGGSDKAFLDLMEKSARHYKTVIDTAESDKLREKAISGIVMSLKFLNRIDEAKKYAEIVPEEARATRDEILSYCLNGAELFEVGRKILYKSLHKTLRALSDLASYSCTEKPYKIAVLDAEEAIINSVINDENYLGFYYYLYNVYLERSECAVAEGAYDEAIRQLKTAKEYAEKSDLLFNSGKHSYTCQILCGYEDEWVVEEAVLHDCEDYWRWKVSRPVFDVIRDREDFKGLL